MKTRIVVGQNEFRAKRYIPEFKYPFWKALIKLNFGWNVFRKKTASGAGSDEVYYFYSQEDAIAFLGRKKSEYMELEVVWTCSQLAETKDAQ